MYCQLCQKEVPMLDFKMGYENHAMTAHALEHVSIKYPKTYAKYAEVNKAMWLAQETTKKECFG